MVVCALFSHPPCLSVLPSNTYAQAKFTADQHPQYIYSPRELSRWVRALYEAMNPLDAMTLDELVRLWANEALRLFHDRLVTQGERDWCQEKVRILLLPRYEMWFLVVILPRSGEGEWCQHKVWVVLLFTAQDKVRESGANIRFGSLLQGCFAVVATVVVYDLKSILSVLPLLPVPLGAMRHGLQTSGMFELCLQTSKNWEACACTLEIELPRCLPPPPPPGLFTSPILCKVGEVARKHFPGVHSALERPLLFSSWLTKVCSTIAVLFICPT